MKLNEKLQMVLLPIAITSGFLLSQNSLISDFSGNLTTPLLLLMIFSLFMNIPLKNFKKEFINFKFIKIALLINFIWTPILSYILGYIFLSQNIYLWIGFIMLLVTPCTDWYMIFTDLAKGNMKLSFSILPLNLLLQLILLPVYLFLFTGVLSGFDLNLLIETIFLIIILPFILSQVIKHLVNIDNKLSDYFELITIVSLSLAIFTMFSSKGSLLINNTLIFIILLIPFALFFIINFILTYLVKIAIKMNHEDYVSLSLTTLARNSPISLAVAATAFPNHPIIALSLVIAPLIELPTLTIVSYILRKLK
ncbi:MAG: arsenic resistance protein [Methanobrevibacter sp.]|jgi:ACR3 family arsenite efflux pump ArsB|nr:arsenic resistance protein [Candidatus Methanovirga basalitermitum]